MLYKKTLLLLLFHVNNVLALTIFEPNGYRDQIINYYTAITLAKDPLMAIDKVNNIAKALKSLDILATAENLIKISAPARNFFAQTYDFYPKRKDLGSPIEIANAQQLFKTKIEEKRKEIDKLATDNAPQLSAFPFNAASVLPIVKTKDSHFVILGKEAHGFRPEEIDSWDAFGGKKDPGETHPVVTAAREFNEETGRLFFTEDKQAREYIEPHNLNTEYVVANKNKNAVIYLTKISKFQSDNFFKKFYSAITDGEKDLVGLVDWNTFANVIANAPRNPTGQLVIPIQVKALVARGTQLKPEIIKLRPYFVSTLQPFFKDLINNTHSYTFGRNLKIRFY